MLVCHHVYTYDKAPFYSFTDFAYVYIGAFGEVRMCVHRDTGAQRAVKVLRKAHMDEDEKKMLFNEINILRNLVSASPYIFPDSLFRSLLFFSAPI